MNLELEGILRIVLVTSGSHHKIPHTGWLKYQKCLFSRYWRLESKIRVPAQPGSGEGLLLACRWSASCCVPTTAKRQPWCPFLQGRSSHHERSTLRTSLNLLSSRCPHLQSPSLWGLGLQHRNCKETQFSPQQRSSLSIY